MKYILVILGCFYICSCKNNKAQLELEGFINKPFSNFIINKEYSDFKSFNWIDEPPLKLKGILLEYAEKKFAEVTVKEFKYVKRYNENRDWSLEDFKKEKIHSILIYKETNNGRVILFQGDE